MQIRRSALALAVATALAVLAGCAVSSHPTPQCDLAAQLAGQGQLAPAAEIYARAQLSGEGRCADTGLETVANRYASAYREAARGAQAELTGDTAGAQEAYESALTLDKGNQAAANGLARLAQPAPDRVNPVALPPATLSPAPWWTSWWVPLLIALVALVALGVALVGRAPAFTGVPWPRRAARESREPESPEPESRDAEGWRRPWRTKATRTATPETSDSAAESTPLGEPVRPAAPVGPVGPVEPVGSATPGESAAPDDAPVESAALGESGAPIESAAPGERAAPAERATPGERAAPAEVAEEEDTTPLTAVAPAWDLGRHRDESTSRPSRLPRRTPRQQQTESPSPVPSSAPRPSPGEPTGATATGAAEETAGAAGQTEPTGTAGTAGTAEHAEPAGPAEHAEPGGSAGHAEHAVPTAVAGAAGLAGVAGLGRAADRPEPAPSPQDRAPAVAPTPAPTPADVVSDVRRQDGEIGQLQRVMGRSVRGNRPVPRRYFALGRSVDGTALRVRLAIYEVTLTGSAQPLQLAAQRLVSDDLWDGPWTPEKGVDWIDWVRGLVEARTPGRLELGADERIWVGTPRGDDRALLQDLDAAREAWVALLLGVDVTPQGVLALASPTEHTAFERVIAGGAAPTQGPRPASIQVLALADALIVDDRQTNVRRSIATLTNARTRVARPDLLALAAAESVEAALPSAALHPLDVQ